jgi:hypothetical protein
MKMNEFITETGFLTEDGKRLVNQFEVQIQEALMVPQTESEKRLVGSILKSLVDDAISKSIRRSVEESNKR